MKARNGTEPTTGTTDSGNPARVDSSTIYSRIFDAIVDHKLPPGTHLKEDELCDLFGVGRTRVRSALSRLAADHVIELVANRGAFVASPSVEEAREVFRARRVIEGHLIRRAAERRNPPMQQALTEHLHGEHTAREAGDTAQVIRRCSRYHQLLADQADSPIMAGFIRELIARSSLIVAIYEKSKPDKCEIDEHRLLSDLVLAGRADEAAALMDRHLQGIEDRLDLKRESGTINALSQSLGFN
ncbi:GntR family transcriptional regulator [Leisingera daeponensis]|uniref:GntR family transcriptional regulator n=1 Tax=Leisingera daeponensis TaxID=405746 RepID=A0ABS7NGG2_9RHOB|nr:GntR family transcriptional regulator [Leisingera daeponensis]MBY6059193.1 GntR family transcriptional regulator [Leisingera daeponensis]MBY6140299.1 GntR family transcriptional regulator [Leisingera daeponensis]